MKNLFPLYIVLMFFSTQIFGQFQVGIGGGLSTATVKYVGIDPAPDYRTGFLFAVPLSYQISPKITAALIPGFVQKGFIERTADNQRSVRVKTNYIQVTPEIRYSIFDQFYVGFGMYYGRNIGEYSKQSPGSGEWINLGELGLGVVEDNDIGLTPSISYNIGDISISLRYLHGLSNVLDVEVRNVEEELIPVTRTFNQSFELAAFYVFGF